MRTPRAPLFPGVRAPQSPDDKHRLEEQSDAAGGIRVQAEAVGTRNELRDVAWEHQDEKRRDHPPGVRSPLARPDKGDRENDLDDARDDHDGIRSRHPRRNLGAELGHPGEVADPGEEQHRRERPSGQGFDHTSTVAMRSGCGVWCGGLEGWCVGLLWVGWWVGLPGWWWGGVGEAVG